MYALIYELIMKITIIMQQFITTEREGKMNSMQLCAVAQRNDPVILFLFVPVII